MVDWLDLRDQNRRVKKKRGRRRKKKEEKKEEIKGKSILFISKKFYQLDCENLQQNVIDKYSD